MRPPVSPLSTTTTRRTSCTLATRIPPNYEPGSRFRVLEDVRRVLLPLVDRLAHIFLVLLRVRALPAHGDSTEVRDQGGVLHVHRRRRLRGRLLRHVLRVLRDGSDGAPRVPRGRDGHRALRVLLVDGGEAFC